MGSHDSFQLRNSGSKDQGPVVELTAPRPEAEGVTPLEFRVRAGVVMDVFEVGLATGPREGAPVPEAPAP